MNLTAPVWSNLLKPGLRSAKENVADSSVRLLITPALPSNPAFTVLYLIYAGPTSPSTYPLFITDKTDIDVPGILVGADWKFKVSAINGAISNLTDFDIVAPNLYSYPDPTETLVTFTSADSVLYTEPVQYPFDGYLILEGEVVQYAGYVDSTESEFNIVDRGLFNTNTPASIAIGTSVEIFRGSETTGPIISSLPACGLSLPVWIDNRKIGLLRVEDLGDGENVKLIANYAEVPAGFSNLYYVFYRSENPLDLFKKPAVLSISNESILNGVRPTTSYYYGARATYFLPDFSTSGMTQTASGFIVPDSVTLSAPMLLNQIGSILVSSTAGFPDAGTLKIGREIVKYSSKGINSFNLVSRDVLGAGRSEDLDSGTVVEFFSGVTDGNSYFWRMTNSWGKDGVKALPLIPGDGFWGNEYLQDPDGYRNIPISPVIEDHTFDEEDGYAADAFDYCGFRSTDQSQFLSGDYCGPASVHGGGTYHGNSMSGEGGGINVYEGTLEREEMLLGITGEPFVLLRRKWNGRTCPYMSNRDEHANGRCGVCFHTGFIGGFDRYVHPRRIRPAEANPNGFFQMRVSPYNDEVDLNETRGLTVEKTDQTAWCPAIPIIKDRDVLVKYRYDYDTGRAVEEFRYEVLTVQRNTLVLSKNGAQQVTMKRLNVTDEIYKFPVNLI